MYMMFKHIHLTAIALSLFLLIFRFILQMKDSPMVQKKFFKIAPHVIDTILLVSAIGLCITLQQYPFVNAWLTEKFILLFAYIFAGLYALKLASNKPAKIAGFVTVLFIISCMVHIAITKSAFLL